MSVNIIWFRHGLRLHDNPALIEAISDKDKGIQLLPIFIFDGESAGTKSIGYNRLKFLLDSLKDLHDQFQKLSLNLGRLYVFKGNPVYIFHRLHKEFGIHKLCFEQDCEPIWNKRDNAVKKLCLDLGITSIERIAHTLWDPKHIIDTNGGMPPLTYEIFLQTVDIIGLPPRPVAEPDWENVKFFELGQQISKELSVYTQFPTPECFNVYPDHISYLAKVKWIGGETEALLLLEQRLKVEGNAFKCGYYLPNQARPNILESPKSLSAHLRFGCLSVRKFYWDVHDLFKDVQVQAEELGRKMFGGAHITGQLIWREYFYTMSVNNPNYDRMEGNDICLRIPWANTNQEQLNRWTQGQTGFPLIDAAMHQLLAEGWLHHTLRNAVATFLTRGGLWQNWEHGLRYFLKHLLDADWSVCAGNWMWVSSSAFEYLLESSLVTCPVAIGRRLDPSGQYIKHYVPQLVNVPKEYIHEPWNMPLEIQKKSDCIIGVQYPKRLINFAEASQRNMLAMRELRTALLADGAPEEGPPHCRPSNEEEIRNFFWLDD